MGPPLALGALTQRLGHVGNGLALIGETALGIADAVRQGTISPVDVVEAHLAHIGAVDARLGAFQLVRAEAALDEARRLAGRDDLADLPLAGVPIAIKDNIDVAGEPTRNGSLATSATPVAADHELVTRLRAAGAIVVGKTRVPELCAWGWTDSAFGVSRNPWNPDRTPGGSSGGSAAAVAAGMVPVAHGSDGGGSIRIPSAACGLVGMKPGIGVLPGSADRTGWYGLSSSGALATTVDDVAVTTSVMAQRPDLRWPGRPDLRVAVSTRAMIATVSVEDSWARAATDLGQALTGADHKVVRADPPYDRLMLRALGVRGMAGIAEDARGLRLSLLEPRTRPSVAIGRALTRLSLLDNRGRDHWRRTMAEFFDDIDVLLTPTLGAPVPQAEGWARRSWLANLRGAGFAMFTGPWNLAGFPALALPAGIGPDGMPLSVQLVAPEGGEALLLSLAKQLEGLRPWPRHAPAEAKPTG
jgi:amidase